MENTIKYASWSRSYEVHGAEVENIRRELKNIIRSGNSIEEAKQLIIGYLDMDSMPDVIHFDNEIAARGRNGSYRVDRFYSSGVEFCHFFCGGIYEAYTEDDEGWNTIEEEYPTFAQEDYNSLLSAFGLDEEPSEQNWFAILTDEDDTDWGTGSFDFSKAVKAAKTQGCNIIAEIDGKYDADGNATADPVCVKLYKAGEDF